MFLKNKKNISSKIKRSKVTDYAALNNTRNTMKSKHSSFRILYIKLVFLLISFELSYEITPHVRPYPPCFISHIVIPMLY